MFGALDSLESLTDLEAGFADDASGGDYTSAVDELLADLESALLSW